MKTNQEELRVGSPVSYRRFIRLERINPMGQHETVELDHEALDMVVELP